MKVTRRPKPVEVGPLSARAVKRYPRKGKPYYVREDGRAYWQARSRSSRATVWSGWANRDEVAETMARLVSKGLVDSERAGGPPGRVANVGELLGAWVDEQRRRLKRPRSHGGIAQSTCDFYEKAGRHLTAWLGEVVPAQLSIDHMAEYAEARLVDEGASPRLVHSELARLRQAWTWGAEHMLVPDRRLPKYHIKIDEREFCINHRTPSPDEAELAIACAHDEPKLALQLLAMTGARVSEVCHLAAADVDPFHGTLRLVGKTGPRWFPLRRAEPALFDVLDNRARCRSPEERLLVLRAHPAEQVRSALRRACAAARIPRFTPHGLRRMVVNRLIDAGIDVSTAAALTGHSVEVMLRYYRKPTPAGLGDAVARAGLGQLGPTEAAAK